MNLKDAAEKKAVETFVNHQLKKLEKEPVETFKNLMGYAKKLKVFEDETFDKAIRVADDPNNGWTKYGIDIAQNIDRNILYKTIMNFGYEASLYGSKVREKHRQELGTKLNHNSMDDPTYDEKVLERKDFDFTVLGGYMGPDISAMGIRFVTGGPMNYGNYSNPELDKEFELANIATEYEDRAVHYRRIQEILYEDLPVVYFSNKGVEYPIKNYVKGSPADEATPYTTEAEFSRVWIDPSLR